MGKREAYWFDYSLTARQALAEEYQNLPLAVLDLSVRTRNALRRHDRLMDVATLLCADKDILNVRGLGPGGYNEINDLFMPLIEGREIALAVNEKAALGGSVSPYIPLPSSIAALSVGLLHLPKRAFGALERMGIETIGEIERASVRELEKIPNLGVGGINAIYERISALRGALDEEQGQVDWFQFWSSQGIALIPPVWSADYGIKEVVIQLPRIIESVCSADGDESTWYVIKRRFGLDGKPTLTLDELGTAFSLTRERIRQIEEKRIRRFRDILLGTDYSGKSYHVHPDVILLFENATRELVLSTALPIPETDLQEKMTVTFGVSNQSLRRIWLFLLAVSDVQRLNLRIGGMDPILYSISTILPAQSEVVIPIIHNFLTHQAMSASDVDILLEVNQQLRKKDRIQLRDLRMLMPLCRTIEIVEPGVYQGKFEHLSTRVDQIERILIDEGRPLTVADICREMNYRILNSEGKTVTERNVANQIGSDGRFSPIGRSGLWTLSRWSTETGTIVDLMKQYLMAKNAPATGEEITTYVQEKRPASDASIQWYLGFYPAFAQVTRNTWGLATWEEALIAKTWNPEEVASFVEEFFRRQKVDRADYMVLKKALMEETGYTAKRVQGLLNLNPSIATETVKGDKRIAIFQPDYRAKLGQRSAQFASKRKTLFEQIGDDIRQALESSPGQQMGLGKLIALLTEKHGHRYKSPYPSLHGYVSRMDFVEKVPIEGSKQLMCRLVNSHADGLKSRADKISSSERRANVLRALDFLTEEDVDIAHFLLGKEFEVTLKRYVTQAVATGRLEPSRRKNPTLNDMIDMVSNGGVVTDDTILTILRKSRNERAHGSMPPVAERKILLAHGDLIVETYIDYIQFFDELALDLEASS